jgi:hypothetical protein
VGFLLRGLLLGCGQQRTAHGRRYQQFPQELLSSHQSILTARPERYAFTGKSRTLLSPFSDKPGSQQI